MPACLAASMIVVPLGTLSVMPSIVTLTRSSAIRSSSDGSHGRLTRTGHIGFEFGSELLDPADHRRGARVAQHTDGRAGHVLRQVEQQLKVFLLALPRQDALENLGGPRRAFAALGALGTALVGVEPRQPPD